MLECQSHLEVPQRGDLRAYGDWGVLGDLPQETCSPTAGGARDTPSPITGRNTAVRGPASWKDSAVAFLCRSETVWELLPQSRDL